jgi:uncharacterized protein
VVALVTWLLAAAAWAAPPPIPASPHEHVTDTAGVLSEGARRSLTKRLEAYERGGGHQVVVYVAESTGGRPIEEFAVEAFEQWKVGRKGLDDGVALFVFVEDRKVRIEVGYGVEDRLTDLLAGKIVRDVIVPDIKAGNFDAAITRGSEAIVSTLGGRLEGAQSEGARGNRGPPPRIPGTIEMMVYIVLGIAFLILLITNPRLALMLLFMLGRGGGRRGGGGGGFGGGGFSGGGGRSGGGGATGGW